MNIINSHQEYWKTIFTYHRSPPTKRASFLEGYLKTVALTHEDPKTRHLVNQFYLQEQAKADAAKSRNPTSAG